jgi:MFS family permease
MDGYRWADVRDEFARGWKAVLAGALALGVGTSLYGYLSSLFLRSVSQDFGWTYTQASLSILVVAASALFMPLVGVLVQRWGTRKASGLSYVLLAIAYLVLTQSPGDLLIYHLLFFMAMLVGAATGPLAISYLINQWFDKGRGLALAAALSGASLMPIALAPMMGALIHDHTWRGGFVAMAALALFVGLPAVLLGFQDRVAPRASTSNTGESAPGLEAAAVYRTARFWVLCSTIFLVGAPVIGVANQLQSIGVARGLDATLAATLISAFAAGVLAGRMVTGYLIDRFWAPGVGACVLLVAACGATALTVDSLDPAMLLLAVGVFGMAQGAELDLMAYLTARYFGLRSYGAIYGSVNIAFAVSLPVGALSFGYVYDTVGTIDPALWSAAVLLIISAALLLCLGPYPRFAGKT